MKSIRKNVSVPNVYGYSCVVSQQIFVTEEMFSKIKYGGWANSRWCQGENAKITRIYPMGNILCQFLNMIYRSDVYRL